ncbi:hypothetical protein KX816_15995 [Sphingosinicellaceae bacterium]|nr:hypothetical protein KX816_15995 [Sphingosinicellaceae bacterium]
MKPISNGADDNQDHTADILDDVVLDHFTATSPAIGPFGETTLSWSVSGPAGFHVQLNEIDVERSGSQVVKPPVTEAYRLSARAGQGRRSLSTLSIHVDTSTCAVVQPSFNDGPGEMLKLLVDQVLAADTSLSIAQRVVLGPFGQQHLEPRQPTISFDLGVMTIELHLKKNHVADAPDPDIDVTIKTGLRLDPETGALETVNATVTGEIDQPWWIDLVPVYGLIVSIKTGEAETRLPMQFAPVIAAIPQLVGFVYAIDASRQRYQTVDIPGGDANPAIRLVACAKPRTFPFPTGTVDIGHQVEIEQATVSQPPRSTGPTRVLEPSGAAGPRRR